MRKIRLIACVVALSTGCTITDEESITLDVTAPNLTIMVNNKIAYSNLHSNWQPFSCDDGTIPGFVPDGSGTQGVTVPLDEDLLTPVFPVDIEVLAGDPGSGIRRIRVVTPPGPVTSDDAQATSYGQSRPADACVSGRYRSAGWRPRIWNTKNTRGNSTRAGHK